MRLGRLAKLFLILFSSLTQFIAQPHKEVCQHNGKDSRKAGIRGRTNAARKDSNINPSLVGESIVTARINRLPGKAEPGLKILTPFKRLGWVKGT